MSLLFFALQTFSSYVWLLDVCFSFYLRFFEWSSRKSFWRFQKKKQNLKSHLDFQRRNEFKRVLFIHCVLSQEPNAVENLKWIRCRVGRDRAKNNGELHRIQPRLTGLSFTALRLIFGSRMRQCANKHFCGWFILFVVPLRCGFSSIGIKVRHVSLGGRCDGFSRDMSRR